MNKKKQTKMNMDREVDEHTPISEQRKDEEAIADVVDRTVTRKLSLLQVKYNLIATLARQHFIKVFRHPSMRKGHLHYQSLGAEAFSTAAAHYCVRIGEGKL